MRTVKHCSLALLFFMVVSCKEKTVEKINTPPVVDAGPSQVIKLPANMATLSGTASDDDVILRGYSWTQLLGPNFAMITAKSNPSTTVTGLVAGDYIFELVATDKHYVSAADTMVIKVIP